MFKHRFQQCMQVAGLVALIALSAVGVLALTGGGLPAWAQAGPLATLSGMPNTISYQGVLRNTDGSLVEGTYAMTFRLYDAASGGVKRHEETITGVVVRDGLFTVLLGDQEGQAIPAAAFKAPLYVSVQVGSGDEMAPRQRIAPVPYAVQLTDGLYINRSGDTVHVEVGAGASPAHVVIPKGGLCVDDDGSCTPQTGAVSADRLVVSKIDLQAPLVVVKELIPGDGWYGDWLAWHYCDPGTYVCGVLVRMEAKQGGGDDTSMNGIRLSCCSLGQ